MGGSMENMKHFEKEDGTRILEIEKDESAIIFKNDGTFFGLMADPEDGEFLVASAFEFAIATIALGDPKIRAMIEKQLQENKA